MNSLVKCLLLFLTLQLGACQSLFFWPTNDMVDSPQRFGFDYKDVEFYAKDNTLLHGWYLPAKTAQDVKGTIYFLHGNGGNLSYHIANLYWLTQHGWNIFVIDYRGYGWSQGEPDFESVMQDAVAGYRWLQAHGDTNIVVFGQSLGGAIAIDMIHKANLQPFGLILDSTFASHRDIFQEVLGKSWLFWTFQIPLSWGIPDDKAPKKLLPLIKQVPILIVHSSEDRLIGHHHGEVLFEKANANKVIWISQQPGHANIWHSALWKNRLICQLNLWPQLKAPEAICQHALMTNLTSR